MKKVVIELILSGLAILMTAYILPGVHVDNYFVAIVVAAILTLLNAFLRPLLILLTIPVTVLTLGIFLLFINAFIIWLGTLIVPGFEVKTIWWAILFSLINSIISSILFALTGQKKGKTD